MRLEYLLFRAKDVLLEAVAFSILSLVVLLIQHEGEDQEGLLQIRSSAWLEHYTDNVGVTSSNLVGSTKKAASLKLQAAS